MNMREIMALVESIDYPKSIVPDQLIRVIGIIHHTPEDLSDGDLSERLWAYERYNLKTIPLRDLNLHEWNIHDDLLDEYVEMFRSGQVPPPIVYDPQRNSIIDGSHRANAAHAAGQTHILAYVGQGERADDEVDESAPAEESVQEVHWMVPRARTHSIRDGEYVVAWIDVARLNASWSKDSCYVGPNGADGIGRRYAAFGEWLAEGNGPVEMPEVGLTVWGHVGFGNGRHRFSWMRDHGVTALPVVIPVEDVEAFEEQFATTERKTIIPR